MILNLLQKLRAPNWRKLAEEACKGQKLSGFAHDNYKLKVDGKTYLFRFPMPGSAIMDPHAFKEKDVLKLLDEINVSAPKFIYSDPEGAFLVESFIEGVLVDVRYPPGSPLPEAMIDEMVSVLASMSALRINPEQVKTYIDPAWPLDGVTEKFTRQLVLCSEKVFEQNYATHSEYYKILKLDNDPYAYFRERAKTLAKRPWQLVHGDISRGNAILDKNKKIQLIDWQLALYGDPLYDIAKHIHMWRYLEAEKTLLIKKLKAVLPKPLLVNFDEDLEFYLSLEALKSVITDTVRFPIAFKQERFDVKKEAEYCLYFTDNLEKIAPLLGSVTATPSQALIWFREWGEGIRTVSS